jgi:lipoate-protein ligase A
MAAKEKRRTALRHLTRELVRENFSVPDIIEALSEAMDEQSKRIELDPLQRNEADVLERDALALRRILRANRTEFV